MTTRSLSLFPATDRDHIFLSSDFGISVSCVGSRNTVRTSRCLKRRPDVPRASLHGVPSAGSGSLLTRRVVPGQASCHRCRRAVQTLSGRKDLTPLSLSLSTPMSCRCLCLNHTPDYTPDRIVLLLFFQNGMSFGRRRKGQLRTRRLHSTAQRAGGLLAMVLSAGRF